MSHKTFGEQFADSRGGPINFRGSVVYSIYEMPVGAPTALVVRFTGANPRVRQALRLAVDGGTLLVNDQTLRDVVLWADTAPRRAQVQVAPSGGPCVVKIWNAWQDETGAMQAWIGDCGMLVERGPGGMRLQCSDGLGGPEFGDLVVEIALAPPGS